MKTILIFLAVLALLGFTNPSMQSHTKAINEKCKELNPITGVIGGCSLFSKLGCAYHNCYVFSYTESNGQLVSIGVIGIPFIIKDLNI